MIQSEYRRHITYTHDDTISGLRTWLYCFAHVPQTLSINGSVTVSVLDLSLDRKEMNSRVTCRAINPYLDSTIMEDTWLVNLSCKSKPHQYEFDLWCLTTRSLFYLGDSAPRFTLSNYKYLGLRVHRGSSSLLWSRCLVVTTLTTNLTSSVFFLSTRSASRIHLSWVIA